MSGPTMLVKVGDTWLDPMRVEAVADGEAIDEVITHPSDSFVSGMWFTGQTQTRRTCRVYEGNPCATVWVIDGGEYLVRGVNGDEAARIIDRCREAAMARRE